VLHLLVMLLLMVLLVMMLLRPVVVGGRRLCVGSLIIRAVLSCRSSASSV
jgi:hypothetical protein